MLFKSSALQPDSIAIDASISQVFIFTPNGDALTDFRYKFYKNVDSTLLFDSGKVTSSVAQYTLPANSLTNNLDIKYQVEVFSGATSVLSDFIFLKTYNTPIVSMTVPATISTRSYTFNSSYSQSQNVPYQRFKFILYDNADTVIINSDWQYGYTLQYTFEGFESSKTYKVECIVEGSYSLTGTTGKKSFNVSYTQPDPASYLIATSNDDVGGINLSWLPLVQVTGVVTGTTSYVAGKFGQGIQINNGSKVTFNKTVPIDFTINLWVKLPTGFTGDIITLGNDEAKIGYNGAQFYLISDGKTALSKILSLPSTFFKIALKSDKVIIETDSYTEFL